MTIESDEPRFDLETSLYGPGSISCWYLTFLCVLITWTSHPSKSFRRLSLTADVVLYALYACVAAGHMTVLVRHLESDELAALQAFLRSGSVEKGLQSLAPVVQKTMRGIDGPFRVGTMFLWVALLSFICMVTTADPLVRPRRRPLPWVFCVAAVWVSGCFVFLAARCGLQAVGYAMLACTAKLGFASLLMIPLAYLGIYIPFVAGMATLLLLYAVFSFVVGLSDLLGLRLKHLEGCIPIFSTGSGGWRVIISPPAAGFAWLMFTMLLPNGRMVAATLWEGVAGIWYPDVDVQMSAFDQVLALCSGITAILFTTYTVFGSRRKIRLVRIKLEAAGSSDGHSGTYELEEVGRGEVREGDAV